MKRHLGFQACILSLLAAYKANLSGKQIIRPKGKKKENKQQPKIKKPTKENHLNFKAT